MQLREFARHVNLFGFFALAKRSRVDAMCMLRHKVPSLDVCSGSQSVVSTAVGHVALVLHLRDFGDELGRFDCWGRAGNLFDDSGGKVCWYAVESEVGDPAEGEVWGDEVLDGVALVEWRIVISIVWINDCDFMGEVGATLECSISVTRVSKMK